MEFKDRLRTLRIARNLTQTDLAHVLHYRYTAISNYESERNEPSIRDLVRLAFFFNVTVDYLVCATEICKSFNENALTVLDIQWFFDLYETAPPEVQASMQTVLQELQRLYLQKPKKGCRRRNKK